MESNFAATTVYSKILDKVIIKAAYDQNDDFLFWSLFTNNKKTIKRVFPDLDITDLEFNTEKHDRFETFDLKQGKKTIIDLDKIDCVSIPELPFEFSPVFLFNERFEKKVKTFPYQKIQKKTIFELKKHSIISNKESAILTPKVTFLTKVKPGCDILGISNSEALSNKKTILKTAFANYKKELNKHFKFLLTELTQERTTLQKRLTEGCPFAADSLKTLETLEISAKEEQTSIKLENYLIPLDMITSWPKSLLPSPDWIITDDVTISCINNYKSGILYNKASFVDFYTNIAKNITSFYKVNITNKNNNNTEEKLLGIKQEDDVIELLSIPLGDYVAEQTPIEALNTSVFTNAYAIHHLFFEIDANGKFVESNVNYSIELNNEAIYIKDATGNLLFEAVKDNTVNITIDDINDRLKKFLIVG